MRESEKKMQIVICLRTKHLGFLKNSLKRVRGSKPGPHWRKANALTTAPPLPPCNYIVIILTRTGASIKKGSCQASKLPYYTRPETEPRSARTQVHGRARKTRAMLETTAKI